MICSCPIYIFTNISSGLLLDMFRYNNNNNSNNSYSNNNNNRTKLQNTLSFPKDNITYAPIRTHQSRNAKPFGMRLIELCSLYFSFAFFFVYCAALFAQTDLNERRSRRDMSPQGRKRASAMVARDYRTVSGIGQSYHNNNQTIVVSRREHFAEASLLLSI